MACQQNVIKNCPCTYDCARRGHCCACVQYHLRGGGFPACFFSPEGERAYDRSFQALQADRNRKKPTP